MKKNLTTQKILINIISKSRYRISKVNLMQCSSTYGNWRNEWEKVAIRVNGYTGMNLIGIDLGGN